MSGGHKEIPLLHYVHMSWSGRRRALYFFSVFGVIAVVAGIIGYTVFYDAPTCTDGKQNGIEQGIDCGGDCPIVCSFSAADPIVHWSRLVEVIPSVYTVVALVENPNGGVAAHDIPYTFKLRGVDNLLVEEEKGRFYLPPKAVVPIFVTGIKTGSRVPTRVEFAYGTPVWQNERPHPLDISIDNIDIEREDSSPRLTARLTNHSLDAIPNLPLVAVVYDAEQNVLHASRTVMKDIAGSGELDLVFTWPQAFTTSVGTIDIIPVPQPR